MRRRDYVLLKCAWNVDRTNRKYIIFLLVMLRTIQYTHATLHARIPRWPSSKRANDTNMLCVGVWEREETLKLPRGSQGQWVRIPGVDAISPFSLSHPHKFDTCKKLLDTVTIYSHLVGTNRSLEIPFAFEQST